MGRILSSTILFHHARVVWTPGASQRKVEPGMFRIFYAWVSPDVLDIAMERLSRIVARLRRMNADDWKLAAQTPHVLSDEKPTDDQDQDLSPVIPPRKGGMSHSHARSWSPQAAIHRVFAGVLDCSYFVSRRTDRPNHSSLYVSPSSTLLPCIKVMRCVHIHKS